MKAVYLKDSDALAEIVDNINGRATAHTLSAWDLPGVARRAEKQLADSGVPKKLWRGIRVQYRPAGPGKAYARKGRYVHTNTATLEYRAGGWALVSFTKLEAWADCNEVFTLHVAPEVLERVKEEACKVYRVDA